MSHAWGPTGSSSEECLQCQQRAEKNDISAQFELATMYEFGTHGATQNNENARQWYLRAAEGGHPQAQYRVGLMFASTTISVRSASGSGTDVQQQQRPQHLGLTPQKDTTAALWFTRAAKQGHPEAQCALGELCETGRGVPQMYDKAHAWYQKAANQGCAEGAARLGNMYHKGLGVWRDDIEAIRWYSQAINVKNAMPQHHLALASIYASGLGANLNEAFQHYRVAAEHGHPEAQATLGRMFEDGKGTAQNDLLAIEWYQKAAEQGNAKGQTGLGRMIKAGRGDTSCSSLEASAWFLKAAEQGEPEAMVLLGEIYESRGAPADREALAWYQKAAVEHGCATAQFKLGQLYKFGRLGMSQSYNEAVYWYVKASQQGHSEATAARIALFEAGYGTPMNTHDLLVYHQGGANQGDPECQYRLGKMYENGQGHIHQAVHWYRKAAVNGHTLAQFSLGQMYMQGRGVEKDSVEAVQWFTKAAVAGQLDAQQALSHAYAAGIGVPQDDGLAAYWQLIVHEQKED